MDSKNESAVQLVNAGKMRLEKKRTIITQNNVINVSNDNKFIVSKVENVFNILEEIPSNYKNSLIIFLSVHCLIYSFFWFMFDMIRVPINQTYCMNLYTQEFDLCDFKQYCDWSDKKLMNFIYLNSTNFKYRNNLEERVAINKFMRKYFIQKNLMNSVTATDYSNKFKQNSNFYITIGLVTSGEEFNLFFTFNTNCVRKTLVFQCCLFMLIGLFFGNTFIPYISDVFGRRKPFIITLLILGVTCILLSIFGFLLKFYSEISISRENFILPQKFMFLQSLTDNYLNQFNEIEKSMNISLIIFYNFQKYKFLFFFLLFAMSACYSALGHLSKSYVFETSINDSQAMENYERYYYGTILSYILNYSLKFTDFNNRFAILGVISLILCIFSFKILNESIRHHYEFYEYKKIKEVLDSIILNNEDKNKVKIFSSFNVDYKLQNEINKFHNSEDDNNNIFTRLFEYLKNKRKSNFHNKYNQNYEELYRSDLLMHPIKMYTMLFKSKIIKKNNFVLLSLIINISMIYFILISQLNKGFITTKTDLYDGYQLKRLIVLLLILISQSVFGFVYKIFGFRPLLLYVSFIFLFFLSLIIEIQDTDLIRKRTNLNNYNFNSQDIFFDSNSTSCFSLYLIMIFFSHGMYFSMFLYITRLTRTLYRCLFYGFCAIFLDFTMLVSIILPHFFERLFLYVAIFSALGFINTNFISEFEGSLVEDYRNFEESIKTPSKYKGTEDLMKN